MGQTPASAGEPRHWRGRALTASLVIVLITLAALVTYGFVSSNRDRHSPKVKAGEKDLEDERPGVSTGTESLWDVKVGTDAQARLVKLTPVPTTIAWLTSQPHTSPVHRIAPIEFTVYTVTGTLTNLRQEHDLDQKMTIEDNDGHHMLVELPDVSLSRTGAFAAQIKHAHEELAAWNGNIPTTIRVTGIGFFDEPTGQGDQAHNEIELHPVLDINFDPH
jgi:hypothetical protein